MAETPPAFDAIRTQAGRASPNSPCLGHAQSGFGSALALLAQSLRPCLILAQPPSENDGKYHFQLSKIVQAEGKIKRTMKPSIPQTVPAPAKDRIPRSTVSTLALSLHPENHVVRSPRRKTARAPVPDGVDRKSCPSKRQKTENPMPPHPARVGPAKQSHDGYRNPHRTD